MNKEAFSDLLKCVSEADRKFASTFVCNLLPESFRYFIHMNQSFDEGPLAPDERVFQDGTVKFDERIGPIPASRVVELLWRDGLLPEWVDISVVQADDEHTYFQLLCCGRFTANESRYYYASRGQGPFGIKSPQLPMGWSDDQGRFDLNWRALR